MHRMMQDRVFSPWQKTWTVEDEMKLEELAGEHEFLSRLPYRYHPRFGPPIQAPWEVRLSPQSGAQLERYGK